MRRMERAIERALFVNGERGNAALDERRDGFNETLHSLVASARDSGTLPLNYPGLTVDEIVADDPDEATRFGLIQESLGSECGKYQAVMLGSGRLIEPALAAFDLRACHSSSSPPSSSSSASSTGGDNGDRGPRALLGTFDTSSLVFSQLHLGRLALAISQQQHLQASLPVLHAALYVTTGKVLAPPLEDGSGGVHLTGPRVFTPRDALTDTEQACENEGWPVCPRRSSPLLSPPPPQGDDAVPPAQESGESSSCPCVNRGNVRLGGVVHGVTTDGFWDDVFSASQRAASSFDVHLDMIRFPPQDDERTLHLKMTYKILSLCESGVDGVFVSIPSEMVEGAVRACLELDVPVVSVNAGADASERLGLVHHFGMFEYNAGKSAGVELIKSGIRVGYCVNHAPGVSVTTERCAGFEAAIVEAQVASGGGVRFRGVIDVPHDNDVLYGKRVEDAVGGDPNGDWDGLGFLLCGVDSQLNAALKLKEAHPKLKIGTFDLSEDLYHALDDGRVLFGMDQQAFLQGYAPVSSLVYMATTSERLLNRAIETGPRFVTSLPSRAQQLCEANAFEVCPQTSGEDYSYISDGYRNTGIVLFSIQAFVSVAFIAWTIVNRNKMVVKVSQPEFLVLVAFGCLVLGTAILPTMVQGEYRYVQDPVTGDLLTDVPNDAVRRVDAACMAFPWLAGLGFVLIYSALFAKILRVKKVYDGAIRFSRQRIKVRDTASIVVVMTAVEVTILLSWQLVSPLRWEREVLDVDENGRPTRSVGVCTSDNYVWFLVPFVVFKALCLVYGLLLCYRTRNVPSTLSEGKWISFSVLSMFQILLLAVPVLIIVDDNTDAFFFVRAAVVFLISFSVTALIFFPKAYDVLNPVSENGDSLRFSRGRPSVNVRTVQAQIGKGNFFTDTSCGSCTKSCATHDMTLVCGACKLNAKIMMTSRMSSRQGMVLRTSATNPTTELSRFVSMGEEGKSDAEEGEDSGRFGSKSECEGAEEEAKVFEEGSGDTECVDTIPSLPNDVQEDVFHEQLPGAMAVAGRRGRGRDSAVESLLKAEFPIESYQSSLLRFRRRSSCQY